MAEPTEKRRMQDQLRGTRSFDYLGNGPKATGGAGWLMAPDLFFRCTQCDYFMAADPTTVDTCFCGAMSKDPDYGRFGSDLGDEAIEVYRQHG